ncbi:MAG: hypothetical protein E4H24_02235 [Thermomicrobiales bacterium]|nr:MAG: hypothetical protein E4H24_02235 [Thermomicrobiales bacterium]
MTHEYIIALGGTVLGSGQTDGPVATAVGWAADRVLAVGSDEVVKTISRGDSTFIDVAGCAISQAPRDSGAAELLLRAMVTTGRPFNSIEVLKEAGLFEDAEPLEVGAPADLAFWSAIPETLSTRSATTLRIMAIVRAGAFTEGDEHTGPFKLVLPSG